MTIDRHPRDADSSRPSGFPDLPPTDEELGPSPVHTKPERRVLGPPAPTPQQQAEQQFGAEAIARLSSEIQVGWSEADLLLLEQQLEIVNPWMSPTWRNEISQSVMRNTDPSIMAEASREFYRQLGMSTEDMFTDKAIKRVLGIVSDDEAFFQAARDEWLETHFAVQTAGEALARDDDMKKYFDENYLEPDQIREELKIQIGLDPAAKGTVPWQFSTQITGLRGKSLEWRQDGDRLSMRWFTEDPKKGDPEFVDVLIFLEEGIELVSHVDAMTEYVLATAGLKNLISPSSGRVEGRQSFIGFLIEGFDDLLAKVERNGAAPLIESVNRVLIHQANASMGFVPSPVPEQQKADEDALIEQENMLAVTQEMDDMAVVAAARQAMFDKPELSMSQVVQAGIVGAANISDDEKEQAATDIVGDLDLIAKTQREEESYIGRFFEEEVFPTLIDALDIWVDTLYYAGIVALDIAGSDPRLIQQIANDIREEGLPFAIAAYHESVKDTTFADYYGIDPDSPWAVWVNMTGLLAVDPATVFTLGGAASWRGLRLGLTTVAGAERMVRSRPMMTAFKHIVNDNNVSIVTVFSEGGMRGPAIVKLARIAGTDYTSQAARVKAFQEVAEIVMKEMPVHGGFYIPASSRAVLRRKTNLGWGKLALVTPKDSKARGFFQDVLIRARQGRTVDMSDRGWLTGRFREIEIYRLNDAKGFADDVIEAVGQYEAYRVGDGTIALLEGRVQVLKREIVDLDLGIQPAEIRQVPILRKQTASWDDLIRELDLSIASATDDGTRVALETSRAQAIQARDKVEKLLKVEWQLTGGGIGDAYDDLVRNAGRKRAEIKKLQGQAEQLGTAGRDRSLLEYATLKYADKVYDAWKVPLLKTPSGKTIYHDVFGDIPLRNWDDVVGKGNASARSRNVGGLEPFKEDVVELRKLGMHVEQGVMTLPVSPAELLAWHTMQRNAATRAVWKGWQTAPGRGLKSTMDGMQALFATAVLFNPITALRSHADEIVRFYEQNGMSVNLLRANLPSRIPGMAVGTEATAFTRGNMGSVLAPAFQEWRMVSPGARGMTHHAERWINGSLIKQTLFKEYAIAFTNGVDDAARRALWKEYWDREGVLLAKRATVGGTPINDFGSFDIIHDSLERWLSGIKTTGKRGQISPEKILDDILQAAASGRNVVWHKAVWRQLPDVPAQVSSRSQGAFWRHPIETGFNIGYAGPQNRRGSVFYDHAYEFAKATYDEAFDGKLLTEEWLRNNGYAATKAQAQQMVNAGQRSQVVRDLIAETGMVMERDLQDAAMRYAASSAEDMMYTFGATSIFGKKLQRVYPFGRAQTDYIQWWWKKFTEPTGFSFGGGQLPVLGGAGRMARGIPAVGGNLRLIDRLAHLVNLGTPNERPGTLTPAGIVNHFSFLPNVVDEQLLYDLGPGLSPTAGFFINLPFFPESARNVVQEFHPSHRTFTDPYDSYPLALQGYMDALFPSGGMSIRSETSAFLRLTALALSYMALDYDPTLPLTDEQQRRMNPIFNAQMRSLSGGPWFIDHFKVMIGDWMVQGGNAFSFSPDDDELTEIWQILIDESSRASLVESTIDFAAKVPGTLRYGGSDFAYVESALSVDQFIDSWVDSGSIIDSKRDSILIGRDLLNSGEATIAQKIQFMDEVISVIFNELSDDERVEFLAKNEKFTMNMVSGRRVIVGLVPSDARDAIVDGKIRTEDLDRARELYKQGEEQGWLDDRDPLDIAADMLFSFHRSVRGYLDVIYKDATGIGIDKRSVEIDGKKLSLADLDAVLTPQWWRKHREWLDKTGKFVMPQEMKATLNSGQTVNVPMSEFRQFFLDTKERFAYRIEIDTSVASRLNTVGIDDGPISTIGLRLRVVDGFDIEDFDQTVGLSYYGNDLADAFQAALNAGQREMGWGGFDEWTVNEIEIIKDDADGNEVSVIHNLENLRSRFRVAIALSDMNATDDKRFTEKDYTNSNYGYQLGELDYQDPQPPTLAKIAEINRAEGKGRQYYETDDPELDLTVMDGDTIKIATLDGPVFVRFIGLNAPEKGDPEAWKTTTRLNRLIMNADKVQFVVWEPNRFGLRTSAFTMEENAIVSRDRLLVWLYIDGVPIFDLEEFSRDNIRGVRTGGEAIDFEALRAEELTRREVTSRERGD